MTVNQSINGNSLAKEFINATLHEGFLFGCGTDEESVNNVLRQVHDNNLYNDFNTAVTALLEEEGESHFITSSTDAVHGILNDELSGTQLQHALSFLETGQNTQNASVGGLLVEGLADSVDMSSKLSQGLVAGGLVATGIAMVVPGGKVAVAKVGTTLASTGLMVTGWSAVKNASELVIWDSFSDNPSQARAEDWVDLGRTGGNALMFGVPLGITAYIRGPEAIAKDISWTGQQAAKLPTALKTALSAKPATTVSVATSETVTIVPKAATEVETATQPSAGATPVAAPAAATASVSSATRGLTAPEVFTDVIAWGQRLAALRAQGVASIGFGTIPAAEVGGSPAVVIFPLAEGAPAPTTLAVGGRSVENLCAIQFSDYVAVGDPFWVIGNGPRELGGTFVFRAGEETVQTLKTFLGRMERAQQKMLDVFQSGVRAPRITPEAPLRSVNATEVFPNGTKYRVRIVSTSTSGFANEFTCVLVREGGKTRLIFYSLFDAEMFFKNMGQLRVTNAAGSEVSIPVEIGSSESPTHPGFNRLILHFGSNWNAIKENEVIFFQYKMEAIGNGLWELVSSPIEQSNALPVGKIPELWPQIEAALGRLSAGQ